MVLVKKATSSGSELTARLSSSSLFDAEDICAGLLDRAARLKRVYEETLVRRESSPIRMARGNASLGSGG